MGTNESTINQFRAAEQQLPSNPPAVIPYHFREKAYHPLFGDLIIVNDLNRASSQKMALVETFYSNMQEHKSQITLAKFMNTLKHPNLLEVGYLPGSEAEVFSNCYKLSHIFEYHSLDMHTDFKWKKLHGRHFFSEEEVIEFLIQIVPALAFLQSKGVVHGGVNCYSIVIDQTRKKPVFKLLPPFGLKGHDNFQQVISMGPLAKGIFLSPQQLNKLKEKRIAGTTLTFQNSYKTDVWSLGCIVLAMLRNVESDGIFDYIKYSFEQEGLEMTLKALKEQVEVPFLINMIGWMLELGEEKRCDFVELEKLLKVALTKHHMQVNNMQQINNEQQGEEHPNSNNNNKNNKNNKKYDVHSAPRPISMAPLTKKTLTEEKDENFVEEMKSLSLMATAHSPQKKIPLKNQENESQKRSVNVKTQIQDRTTVLTAIENKVQEASAYLNPQVLKILQDFERKNMFANTNFREKQDFFQQQQLQHSTNIIIEKYSDGSMYEGEKIGNLKHGKGKFYYPDGALYDGDWRDGKINGFGTLFYPNKCLCYIGMWKEGRFHGKGSLYNKTPGFLNEFDGKDFNKIGEGWNKYEGEFIYGIKEGIGQLHLMNGDVFEGEFKGNSPNGKGMFKKEEGEKVYGEWNYGVYQMNEGKMQNIRNI